MIQTFTLAEMIREKNLADLPVLDYREENGRAVIEIQLRPVISKPEKPFYDAEKLIAILRSGRINVGYVTNVTKDIRRERNSSPAVSQPRKSKKR
ncbi:MAG: hypothetical protein ONB44_13790 [candidate division KSB1 bacterium]|nr:hypothetical protein [candidate division KSB1 bacterium]MDZ7303196.1 hypothetical protein [candidate division KSB1 bacterium]MDZ7312192.1 hypothetical protein [candidate division KSB1 bacterium]